MEKLKVKIRVNQLAVDTQVNALNDLMKVCENLVEPFDDMLGFSINSVLLQDACVGGYREIELIIHQQVENDLKAIKTPSIRQSMENDSEQALANFKQSCEKILRGEKRNLVEYLEVVKGKVKVAAGSLEAIQEQHTYCLTDAKEIDAFRLHNEACKAVNNFLSFIDNKPQVIWQLFKYHPEGRVEPSDFIYELLFIPKIKSHGI